MHAGASNREHEEAEEADYERSGYGAAAGTKAPVYRY
jgi:hypothetical protein